MKLRELLQGVAILQTNADLELECRAVSYDSRTTQAGDLFVAMKGYATDGHRYIPAARERGAVCVLCQSIPEDGLPFVQVKDSRRALAIVGANFFGHPAREMTMLAVTGTNGKTTTTYLLRDILQKALGAKVGLIGTNQNLIGDTVLPAERTTPESFELQRLFRRMADSGCTHVVMEVSSHALALDRVWGVEFAVGVFTNLTQDHLDFHKTMENYCDAKAILFRHCAVGVYNADDPWQERLRREATCRQISFACKREADVQGTDIALFADHISYRVKTGGASVAVELGIPGGFNVYNSLGALTAAQALGIPPETSAEILRSSHGVRGRVEVVPTEGKPYTVLIDYAHSPDGLENVLRSVRGFAKGRTVALFGCGGDRDRTKRPKMGAIAGRLADFVVLTSDNPRTEEPKAILQEILVGLEGSTTPYVVMENRVEAIHYVLDHAQKDDVIVLCGKGHETYQEINRVKYPLDERKVVADYLAKK